MSSLGEKNGGSSVRISELDALRGIAAIAVMCFHFTIYPYTLRGESAPLWLNFLKYGVQLFFGISGYVIFMSIGRVSRPVDFIIFRFSRLYPVFWFCVTATWLFVSFFGPADLKVGFYDYLGNLTMVPTLMNVFISDHDIRFKSVDGVYWTLQVELFFYAIMLVVFMARLLRHIEWVALAWNLIGFIPAFKLVSGSVAKA